MTLKNDEYVTFLRKREEETLGVYKAVLSELKKEKMDKNKIDAIKVVIAGHEEIVKNLKQEELLNAI